MDGEQFPADPIGLLRGEGLLSGTELESLEQGGVLAKVIDTDDRSEVLSLAATRVKTTAARVLETLRDLEGRRQEPWTIGSGRLSDPPTARDLAALTLDPGDVKHLARCRLHACGVRLSAELIERYRKELEATPAGTRAERANALTREVLASYAAAYRSRGDAALYEYANNDDDQLRIGDSLKLLLARSQLLRDAAPDLWAFLAKAPAGRPADAEDFIYWLQERFWLLNVLSLSHLAIVDRPTPSGRLVLAASKQLYASHYYESSLGLTLFIEKAGAGGYLVLFNRTRADIRRSGFTWIERVLLRHLVRRRREARAKGLRARLESA